MEIKIDNLDVSLGNKKIINALNFIVNPGELLGIIGPNGSGKSTLLKTIYRVLKPDNGAIFFDGINIKERSYRETARQISVVAQHNDFSFDFTVENVVIMGRAPHKRILERNSREDYLMAVDALKRVGLDGYEDRHFNTLSGGERQRVILARALVQNTDALILDEPTNHLDIKYQLQLMSLVKSTKCTTIAAIHDLNIAAMYCDRIVVLKDGIIKGIGTPKKIFTSEMIKDIYGVKAEIFRTDKGEIHIFFSSARI